MQFRRPNRRVISRKSGAAMSVPAATDSDGFESDVDEKTYGHDGIWLMFLCSGDLHTFTLTVDQGCRCDRGCGVFLVVLETRSKQKALHQLWRM